MQDVRSHFKTLLALSSRISLILLGVTIICLIISLFQGENLWPAYLLSLSIWATISAVGMLTHQQPENATYKEQCFYFALIWLISPAISSFPFLANFITNDFPDFSSAYFEAMSGYTSAGLTMVSDPSQLPASIQLYRSLMQWIGGLGFVLFAMMAIDREHPLGAMLKASGLTSSGKIGGSKLIKAYLSVYISLTLFIFVGLLLLSHPLWEATNHSLTIASTGGFSITSNSLSNYSYYSLFFVSICLFIAALPFPEIYLVSRGKWRIARKNTQLKVFSGWLLLALGLGVLATSQFSPKLFNIISAASTGGFSVGSPTNIHPVISILLVVLMVIGGASASTAGGIKVNRFIWLIKGMKAYLRNEKNKYNFNRESIERSKALKHIRFAGLYLLCSLSLRIIGAIIISLIEPHAQMSDVLFDTASALTTTGLSSGVTGSDLQWGSKWVLSLLMWVGRLEYQTISLFLIMLFLDLPKGRIPNNEKN